LKNIQNGCVSSVAVEKVFIKFDVEISHHSKSFELQYTDLFVVLLQTVQFRILSNLVVVGKLLYHTK